MMSDTGSRWQLEKRVNLGDVLSTLVVAGTLLMFIFGQDKRLTVIEEKQATQASIDAQQNERMREMNGDIKGELRDISGKLDKVFERELGRRP